MHETVHSFRMLLAKHFRSAADALSPQEINNTNNNTLDNDTVIQIYGVEHFKKGTQYNKFSEERFREDELFHKTYELLAQLTTHPPLRKIDFRDNYSLEAVLKFIVDFKRSVDFNADEIRNVERHSGERGLPVENYLRIILPLYKDSTSTRVDKSRYVFKENTITQSRTGYYHRDHPRNLAKIRFMNKLHESHKSNSPLRNGLETVPVIRQIGKLDLYYWPLNMSLGALASYYRTELYADVERTDYGIDAGTIISGIDNRVYYLKSPGMNQWSMIDYPYISVPLFLSLGCQLTNDLDKQTDSVKVREIARYEDSLKENVLEKVMKKDVLRYRGC